MWDANGNGALFDGEQGRLLQALADHGQGHLFEKWPPKGQDDDKKVQMVNQLVHLDKSYPGGLLRYVANARSLLADSKAGTNPLDGYVPKVPEGVRLDPSSPDFWQMEQAGVAEAQESAFVLVAGGLGERLGYSGIKIALPVESVTGKSFMQYYAEWLLAIQGDKRPIPLAIMTSDDTHARTEELFKQHNNFGLADGQVTFIKQEKVACLTDSEAHLSLAGPYKVETKPHGHGDVHGLLHTSGLADQWLREGRKWVCFFQDTNPTAFNGILPALAVSASQGFDMMSIAVNRKAKEAIGAIARLEPTDASSGKQAVTVNVEYNQLDPMLRASSAFPEGDVNDPSTGFSPFPGNINELIVALPRYAETLHATGGVISEFVNPKYKDDTRTEFKKSTRLECMMQDLPKSFPSAARVGFTVLPVWLAYSPVKNSPDEALAKAKSGNPTHSATSSELEVYERNCRLLQLVGAAVVPEPSQAEFNGIPSSLYPMVTWSPSFAITMAQLQSRMQSLVLAPKAVVSLEGRIDIRGLAVSGGLVVEAAPGAHVTLRGLNVQNAGWELVPVSSTDQSQPEEVRIRGFRVEKKETREEHRTETCEVTA